MFDGPTNTSDRRALLEALEQEYAQWSPHPPSGAARKTLLAAFSIDDLGKADVVVLDELLTLARDFRKDDAKAVAKVMSILRPKKA